MPRPRAFLATLALLTAGLGTAGLLTAGLAGCSAKQPSEQLPDGTALVSESATVMADIESAHVRIDTEGEVSSLPLRRADGDLLRSGDSKGTIQLSQTGVLIEYEFVVFGDSIYLKGVTGGWQRLPASMAAQIYDPSAILDPSRGVAKLLATATEAKTEAKESVNGKDAYRVAVKLDNTVASALVPDIAPGVTGKLWLDTQTRHLVRAILTVPGASADKPGTVTLILSAIDVPVTVSAP